ncbi:MAG TPA: lantibiotic dehydratase [Vicinamibacterales bacterium]|nr:lantibiotic dehydratase [Vicinamibacterales bacterium]
MKLHPPFDSSADQFEASGFFVLRTPTLPVETLEKWASGLSQTPGSLELTTTEAWRARIEVLRASLKTIIDEPHIRLALFVASPSLAASLSEWDREPEGRKGRRIEAALVRYLARMSSRATPFGLFSGCSIGILTDQPNVANDLLLAGRDRYRTSLRLDFEYLSELTTALCRMPELRTNVHYYANSSLHVAGDACHFIETRIAASKRSHHLVKVVRTACLDEAIQAARVGASFDSLVQVILDASPPNAITKSEAQEFISDLIDADVLVPSIAPPVTGIDPIEDIVSALPPTPFGAEIGKTLRNVQKRLCAIDAANPEQLPSQFDAVADELTPLPAAIDRSKLIQVDMVKPLDAGVLNGSIVAALKDAVRIIMRFPRRPPSPELEDFRSAFVARYERAWVPLLEAVDEDAGIGFGSLSYSRGSAVLRGLNLLPKQSRSSGDAESPYLLEKVVEWAHGPGGELVIDEDDLPEQLASAPLPDAFAVHATLVAHSPDALRQGSCHILLRSCDGPSGARLLGRFCAVDPEIDKWVKKHLQQEEALTPDVVFAEIVHLPEGRLGNVLYRPTLRNYEIPYLGRSGAPVDRQLPISDLIVTVDQASRIIVRSQRLGCRVIPRLTSAHSIDNPRLAPAYRFLGLLQHEGIGLPRFHWGSLTSLKALPRIRIGNTVVARARWRLSEAETDHLRKLPAQSAFSSLQILREQRKLPRWILFSEWDNELPVDLDNPLSVAAFLPLLKPGAACTLVEMYPSPQDLVVRGPEGLFAHEIIVPFVKANSELPHREAASTATTPTRPPTILVNRYADRLVPPGGSWQFLKLYGGSATLDEYLAGELRLWLQAKTATGLITRWFFVRYGDPYVHLRVRLQGPGRGQQQALSEAVTELGSRLVDRRLLWKFELDTYHREIERYGGFEAMEVAEDVFAADSLAVVDLLSDLTADGLDRRWELALIGVDTLLSDFALALQDRQSLIERMRQNYEAKLSVQPGLGRKLGLRFREVVPDLDRILEDRTDSSSSPSVKQVLERRSLSFRLAQSRLAELNRRGALTASLPDLVSSFAHMHVNRMLRAASTAEEFLIYDFLGRIYRGLANRPQAS